jgi:hypothetical protein
MRLPSKAILKVTIVILHIEKVNSFQSRLLWEEFINFVDFCENIAKISESLLKNP